ncbi:MAG: DUF885 domain-containing protein, partial [Planctomycetota bacterium]
VIASVSVAQMPGGGQEDGESARLLELMDGLLDIAYEADPVSVEPYIDEPTRSGELADVSPRSVERRYNRLRRLRAELRTVNPERLEESRRLDLELTVYMVDRRLDLERFEPEQMPVGSINGPQYWLPQLADFVPLITEAERGLYLDRLKMVERHLAQHTEQMRRGILAGRTPPKVVIRPAIAQARSQVVEDPTASSFYRPFADRPDDPMAAMARAVIREGIVPAYERFAEFLETEYLPACRDTFGISESVDGPPVYDARIREHTTLALTADGVHEIGLAEVARIRAEMFEVIARTDFPLKNSLEGDELFTAFVEYLRTDPRFYFTEAEDLLDAYRVLSKKIDAELPELFGVLPRLPYGVREIPLFAARFSPTAYYYPGSLRDGRAGYFMANTYALDQRPKYDIVALTLHEAVPGHHFQIALAEELEDAHPLRRMAGFTAFVEGWALYAERLGLEVGEDRVDDGVERGLYADPYDDFGRLNYEMWRAMRLVVDTGIHSKGWSRQRAIDFMLANSANTEVDTANEVDRYIGWPGQALGYKLGELKIRELRAFAEDELGDAFDIRAFHDELLSDGALPLPVLESKMRRWVEAQQ